MKFDTINLGLTGYDDLFMSSEERADRKKPKVEEIAISELRPFKDHPFRVKEDEEMEQLKKSIHGRKHRNAFERSSMALLE